MRGHKGIPDFGGEDQKFWTKSKPYKCLNMGRCISPDFPLSKI